MAGNEMGNKKRIRRPGLDRMGRPGVVGPINPKYKGTAFEAAYNEAKAENKPTTKIFKKMTFTPKKKDEGSSTQRRTRPSYIKAGSLGLSSDITTGIRRKNR